MFRSLARFCYRRRWVVLLGWVVLLVGLGAFGSSVAGEFRTEFSLPGSESQEAIDRLEEHGFGTFTGQQAAIVFRSDQGVHHTSVREPMEQFFAEIEQLDLDASIASPYEDGAGHQISEDERIAFASINLAYRSQEENSETAARIAEIGERYHSANVQIEYGGDLFAEDVEVFAEAVGLVGAVIILLIAFGSVLAMGLPIITALFGIGTGVMVVMLGANFVTMPDFTLGLAMMIGIGVGIDYALFIVTRFRQFLHDGSDPETATVTAIDTAGRAVLFAGLTVVIAVLGLLTMGLGAVNGVAIAVAASVLMTMFAALTLLPAMLGFIRERVDRLGIPYLVRAGEGGPRSIWYRWSRVIQRRPWTALVAGSAVLLLLAVPVLDMRLGFGDAGNRPTEDTSRRAYDLLAEGFGPGFNGPLMLVLETPNGEGDFDRLDALSSELAAVEGVQHASSPIPAPDGQVAVMQVIPSSAPQDEATSGLVHHLREDVIPASSVTTGDVLVSGSTAAAVDFADYMVDRMPIFFAIVLGLSFLLLLVVFRSILVPVKAVVMNLISIGAAYGVIVAIFQWGWGTDLLGIGQTGPVEAWVPMMLFPIVFGLSMDYEVFLLSRVREGYDRSRDNAKSVADGLASTARVISAAAAIMVVVFFAFSMTADRSLQLMGIGLAVAILLDATVVRLILVPATMELLGDRNWWLPAWLDRLLPRVKFEAEMHSVSESNEVEGERAGIDARVGVQRTGDT